MMSVETIIEQLKQIIVNNLDVNRKYEEIKEDMSLFEDGIGLDSVAIMEFIAAIEKQFGFQLAESELTMEPFENLQILAQFIQKKLNPSFPLQAKTSC